MTKKFPGYSAEIVTMAKTLYGEARGENGGKRGVEGLRNVMNAYQAVANVIMNRAAISESKGGYWWGNTIQEIASKPSQFSTWKKDDPNYDDITNVTMNDPLFVAALRVAKGVRNGTYADNTNGAEHYYATYANKKNWMSKGVETAEIGVHKFRNLTGIDARQLRKTGFLMANGSSISRFFSGQNNIPLPRPATRDKAASNESSDVVKSKEVNATTDTASLNKSSSTTQFLEVTFDRGDTVYGVAQKYGVNKGDLKEFGKAFEKANPGVQADKVRAGTTYNIPLTNFQENVPRDYQPKIRTTLPKEDKGDSEKISYEVQKGDTLFKIFTKLGVDDPGRAIEESAKLAQTMGIDPRKLQIGTQLQISPSALTPN